ncbi:MAG: flavodoxin family protein [Clostridia bacterium]|jgi:multimeric flavodoxin WrbA|nr:flavodoxin family protein [Clostridia bacterium]
MSVKKVIAINGSPRKTWNTATLLEAALEGAASCGAETELVHLYDLEYQGCTSCFACKSLGGRSLGKCAMRDDLTKVLHKIEQADALLLGSPIYFGALTGEMRSFLERFLFQYLTYDDARPTSLQKKIPTALIYTMNFPEDTAKAIGYEQSLGITENALRRIIGPVEVLYVTDTCQFDDYAKYSSAKFDAAAKAARRKEVFPQDCQKAYDLGAKLIH